MNVFCIKMIKFVKGNDALGYILFAELCQAGRCKNEQDEQAGTEAFPSIM